MMYRRRPWVRLRQDEAFNASPPSMLYFLLLLGACSKATYRPGYSLTLDEPGPRVEAMRLPARAVNGVEVECRVFADLGRLEVVVEVRNESGRSIVTGGGGLGDLHATPNGLVAAVGVPEGSDQASSGAYRVTEVLAPGARTAELVPLASHTGVVFEVDRLHHRALSEGFAVPFWCAAVWWPDTDSVGGVRRADTVEVSIGPIPLCAITPERPRWVPCPQVDPPAPEPDPGPAP